MALDEGPSDASPSIRFGDHNITGRWALAEHRMDEVLEFSRWRVRALLPAGGGPARHR